MDCSFGARDPAREGNGATREAAALGWDARARLSVRQGSVRGLPGSILLVEWTAHPEAPAIQDVGVDHRGADAVVAEQFLHGANVVAGPE